MKKIYMTISTALCTLLLTGTYGQQQPNNSSYENWDNLGSSNEEPTNWNGMMTGDLCFFCGFGQSQRTFPDMSVVHTGTYSVRIETTTASGNIVNGALTTGEINAPSTTPSAGYNETLEGNGNFSHPFTDSPDSVVFWAQYNITDATDSARVSFSLHESGYNYRDPENAASTPYRVAKAIKNFQTGGTGSWVRISVPFDYNGAGTTPAFLLATFTSSYAAGAGNASATLWVDDVEFIYNSTALPPVASYTASTPSICVGESITFTDNSTNTPDTWAWDFGDGSGTSSLQNPSYTFTSSGPHTVQLTASNGAGSDVTTQVITVNALPTVTGSGNVSICEGSSTLLAATGTATSYSWDQGLGTGATHTVSPTSLTTYEVTGIDGNGCQNTDQITVTVDTQSSPGTAAPMTVCIADNAIDMFTGITGEDGGGSWSDDTPSGGLTGSTLDATGLVAGNTYGFTYSFPANGACPAVSTSTQVTVTSTADAGTPTGLNSVCVDATSFDLFGTISGNGSGGTWSDDDATGALSGSNINPTTAGTGMYDFTYTLTSGTCGTDTETITVTVNGLPTIDAGTDVEVCDGQDAVLTATGGSTYDWDNSLGAGASQTVTPAATTTYIVTGTDVNGCDNTAQVTVTVNPLPTVSMDPFVTDTVCHYDDIFTLPAGMPTGGTYAGPGVSGSDFSPVAAGDGTHTITYSYTDANTCTNSVSADIVVEICMGIFEDQMIAYTIAPNPALDVLTITFDETMEVEAKIVDMHGKVIYTHNINSIETTIDVSNWTPGMYFVRMTDTNGNSVNTHKIAVQH